MCYQIESLFIPNGVVSTRKPTVVYAVLFCREQNKTKKNYKLLVRIHFWKESYHKIYH